MYRKELSCQRGCVFWGWRDEQNFIHYFRVVSSMLDKDEEGEKDQKMQRRLLCALYLVTSTFTSVFSNISGNLEVSGNVTFEYLERSCIQGRPSCHPYLTGKETVPSEVWFLRGKRQSVL